MAIRGLGRGLESLIPASIKIEKSDSTAFASISQIQANKHQPRKRFDDESIRELADSIREKGIIQPLIVSPIEDKSGDKGGETEYELVAGERRWRAAKIAGLSQVPIIVKKASDKEKLQISLIENIQREDLNPIEEALAYKRLMDEFSLTQDDCAKTLGKGRVVIANTLRLLQLPQSLQDAVSSGKISSGHARNLASISDEKLQKEIAQKILRENLTVREVEKIVSDWKSALTTGKIKLKPKKDPEIRDAEESLQKILATNVNIRARGKGKDIKGWVSIAYYSLDDLERVIRILKKK